jgi:hypothetical protein
MAACVGHRHSSRWLVRETSNGCPADQPPGDAHSSVARTSIHGTRDSMRARALSAETGFVTMISIAARATRSRRRLTSGRLALPTRCSTRTSFHPLAQRLSRCSSHSPPRAPAQRSMIERRASSAFARRRADARASLQSRWSAVSGLVDAHTAPGSCAAWWCRTAPSLRVRRRPHCGQMAGGRRRGGSGAKSDTCRGAPSTRTQARATDIELEC